MYITVHLTIGQMKLFVLWNRSYDNVPCIIVIEIIRCPDVLQLFLKLREYTKIYYWKERSIATCVGPTYTDQRFIR
jgi:hypothetical protein